MSFQDRVRDISLAFQSLKDDQVTEACVLTDDEFLTKARMTLGGSCSPDFGKAKVVEYFGGKLTC